MTIRREEDLALRNWRVGQPPPSDPSLSKEQLEFSLLAAEGRDFVAACSMAIDQKPAPPTN
jgi:hypothetical protein